MEKIDEYIADDITKLLHMFKVSSTSAGIFEPCHNQQFFMCSFYYLISHTYVVQEENEPMEICKPLSWIHSDIMEDNIHMEPCYGNSCLNGTMKDADLVDGSMNGNDSTSEVKSCRASHLLDFSDLSLG